MSIVQQHSRIILLVGVFLLITGVRLAYLAKYGDSYPYYDSWISEGEDILPKSDLSRLNINDLIEPHNEHRIACTRLASLVAYKISGVWDNSHQVITGIVLLTSGTMCGISYLTKQEKQVSIQELICATIPALSLGSFDNALWGFQTQFFFLYYFMFLVLVGILSEDDGWRSAVWLFLASVGALFSLGSGVGVAVGGLGLLVLMCFGNKKDARRLLQKAAPLFIVFLAGLTIFTGRVKGDLMGGAETVRDFILALSKNLAWPWCLEATGFLAPLTAAFLWLPVVVLFFMWIVGGRVGEKRTLWAIGLGIMVFIQAAGIAWGRGFGGVPPQVRHLDLLSWGIWAQGLAWVLIMGNNNKKWMRYISLVWVVVVLSGVVHLQIKAWGKGGIERRAHLKEQRVVVAEYINSNYDPNLVIIAGGYLRMLKNFSTPISPEAVRWAYENRVLPVGEFGDPAAQGRGAWVVKILLDKAWWISVLGIAFIAISYRAISINLPVVLIAKK